MSDRVIGKCGPSYSWSGLPDMAKWIGALHAHRPFGVIYRLTVVLLPDSGRNTKKYGNPSPFTRKRKKKTIYNDRIPNLWLTLRTLNKNHHYEQYTEDLFISLLFFLLLITTAGQEEYVSKEFILSEIKRKLFLSANTKSV